MARRTKTTKESPPADSFAGRLDALMIARGLSNRSAATAAGVNQSTLNNWRSGHLPTDFPAVKMLARALGTSMAFLLTGEADEPPGLAEVLEDGGEVFDGILEVRIKRLIPRRSRTGAS